MTYDELPSHALFFLKGQLGILNHFIKGKKLSEEFDLNDLADYLDKEIAAQFVVADPWSGIDWNTSCFTIFIKYHEDGSVYIDDTVDYWGFDDEFAKPYQIDIKDFLKEFQKPVWKLSRIV